MLEFTTGDFGSVSNGVSANPNAPPSIADWPFEHADGDNYCDNSDHKPLVARDAIRLRDELQNNEPWSMEKIKPLKSVRHVLGEVRVRVYNGTNVQRWKIGSGMDYILKVYYPVQGNPEW